MKSKISIEEKKKLLQEQMAQLEVEEKEIQDSSALDVRLEDILDMVRSLMRMRWYLFVSIAFSLFTFLLLLVVLMGSPQV